MNYLKYTWIVNIFYICQIVVYMTRKGVIHVFVKSKTVAKRRCRTEKLSTLFENSFGLWQVRMDHTFYLKCFHIYFMHYATDNRKAIA
jgi:hypothetical protein